MAEATKNVSNRVPIQCFFHKSNVKGFGFGRSMTQMRSFAVYTYQTIQTLLL